MGTEKLGLLRIDEESIIFGLIKKNRGEESGYEIADEIIEEYGKEFYKYFKEYLTVEKAKFTGDNQSKIRFSNSLDVFNGTTNLFTAAHITKGYFKDLFNKIHSNLQNAVGGLKNYNGLYIKLVFSKPDIITTSTKGYDSDEYERLQKKSKNLGENLADAIRVQVESKKNYSFYGRLTKKRRCKPLGLYYWRSKISLL